MKNIILLLMLQFYIKYLFCNDSFMAKFHQDGFKLRDVRIDLVRFDENYFNSFKLNTFKYNRTTPATNATFNFKINVQDKLEVVLQSYKFMSNEYRYFPMRFQVNLKRSVDANLIGLRSVKQCGNTTTFYFYKNVTYHLCNFVVDETRFPPLIPSGRYQNELSFMYLNKEVLVLNMLGEVYTPIAYPKK